LHQFSTTRPGLKEGRYFKSLKTLTGSGMPGVASDILLEEFVMLFMDLSSVVLNDQKDEVVRGWTEDGKYAVTTTYECQLLDFLNHMCLGIG
jgi:hypothetical protein